MIWYLGLVFVRWMIPGVGSSSIFALGEGDLDEGFWGGLDFDFGFDFDFVDLLDLVVWSGSQDGRVRSVGK